MRKTIVASILLVAALPNAGRAQTITGSVTDPTGAELPGVANEASRPALIKGTRSATTDAEGRYRIGSLRSGTYAVRFSLGRSLSGNAPNVTVNLIAPGTRYGDRIDQLDVRVSKGIKRGRTQSLLAVDAYKALNSSAVPSYNTTFVPGGAWPQPNSILTPRLVKITAEVTF